MMWLIEPSPYEGRYTRFIMKWMDKDM
jgi:hypothetical protein